MNRRLFIFYAIALALHCAAFFYLKTPAPQPPKMVERTYIDVALTAPPAPPAPVQPKPQPTPPVPVPPQKTETLPPPKPELKPEPPVKTEMAIPTPKPEPPPVVKTIVVPPPKPSPEYVPVTQPNYARRAPPIYPDQARRWHQQGIVTLALFINEHGALERVEIIKSSGYSLLDAAAVKAMKQSRFEPAMDGATPVRSRAEATVTFRLE
jgi:periplasmic protein TonB